MASRAPASGPCTAGGTGSPASPHVQAPLRSMRPGYRHRPLRDAPAAFVHLLPTQLLAKLLRGELPRPPRSGPQLLAALWACLRPMVEGHRQRVLDGGKRAGEGGNI